MHAFVAIDLLELVTVTGGEGDAPAPNTEETSGSGNLGVTYKGTQVGLQGQYGTKTSKQTPAQCAQDIRAAGGTPTDILKCYGK